MALRMSMLPENGIEVLAFVGATYVVLSIVQVLVPKDTLLARLIATFTADLRGVMVATGREQTTKEPKKKDRTRKYRVR